ncbi:MAG: glycosyltransferase family 4 protein [Anaerolineae bacterium]|nr:glycosyltransferase family 4 protein [Anaerolineae bacterium]
MKLIYLANIRLPTEKAHGLQIVQNCEAFADVGAEVELWVARRVNSPEMNTITDIYTHYGVKQNFRLRRLLSLDLLWLPIGQGGLLARVFFVIQSITFILAALTAVLGTRTDVYYSRDALTLLAISLIKPRHALAYEAHNVAHSVVGRWIQRQTVRRVGQVFGVTQKLCEDLRALGADPSRIQVAPDGIRGERFANLPTQAEARRTLGWPDDNFIVGYVGRLQTLAQDKGVGLLVEALAQIDGSSIALVGGPDEMAEALRRQWLALGQDDAGFLYAGQVQADRVARYLVACDVCVLTSPWTTFFAYYTSPLKLFEYMAAGRAIVASDLPSTHEIVVEGETALFFPPGDVEALTTALKRLRDDPTLRQRMGAEVHKLAFERYTWEARARAILEAIKHDAN